MCTIVAAPGGAAGAVAACGACATSPITDRPSFFILGSVVLAVTGGEALYADMGHFGARPIRIVWLAFVLPALVLCYFGQGALLIADPTIVESVLRARARRRARRSRS